MKRDIILHHIVSLLIFIGYYTLINYTLQNQYPVFDALVVSDGLHRIWIVALLLVLFAILPVCIYTALKNKLLPLLGQKERPYLAFLKQNAKLFLGAYLTYFIWNLVGGGLREPTTISAAVILILYGLLFFYLESMWILYVQLVHKTKSFTKARAQLKKQNKYGLQLFLGIIIYFAILYFGEWYALTTSVSLQTQGILAAAITFAAIAAYTYWQEQLF